MRYEIHRLHRRALIATAALVFMGLVTSECAAEEQGEFERLLQRVGIDAYSSAVEHGDQATADALLDEDVLFSGGDGLVQRDEKRDRSDSISVAIRSRTQVMRAIRFPGDRTPFDRDVDRSIVAVDEAGVPMRVVEFPRNEVAMFAGGLDVSRTIRDWVVHHDDRFAVASYVEDQATRFGGQVVHFNSLIVDSWALEGSGWKLLASQAVALHNDPPTAPLVAGTLGDYVGAYAVGAEASVSVEIYEGGLKTSLNGGAPTHYVCESTDVFYAAGLPAGTPRSRIYFRRDGRRRIVGYESGIGLSLHRLESIPALGKIADPSDTVSSRMLPAQNLIVRRWGDIAVATFIHERVTQYDGQVLHTRYRSTETWVDRHGTWKMLALQSTQLENAPPGMPLPTRELSPYLGRYTAGADSLITLGERDGALFVSPAIGAGISLRQVAPDDFVTPSAPWISVIFQRDRTGEIAALTERIEDRDLVFERIGDRKSGNH